MKSCSILKLVCFIFIVSTSAFSADRWPFYVRFKVDLKSDIRMVSTIVTIDKVTKDTIYAYATAEEIKKLDSLGYSVKITGKPPTQKKLSTKSRDTVSMATQSQKAAANLSSYPTYSSYVATMNQFAADYPSLCTIENAGSTVNGHNLLIARISSAASNAAKPNVFFAGNIHGDETGGFVLMLKLIDYLLTSYGQDSRATAIVDNVVLYVNPSANPDGLYYYGDNTICDNSHPDCYLCRFNGNGVDLNRNMPMIPDDNSAIEPENQAMINFFNTHRFVLSIDYHAGREQVAYPWFGHPLPGNMYPDYSYTADQNWYVSLSQQYAQTVQASSPAGYFTQHDGYAPNISGIDNAYSVYTATGTREDYMNYWQRGRAVAVEIGYNKYLPESDIDSYWNYHRNAMFSYIESSLKGIQGMVTDAATGQPLLASIEVLYHDGDRSGVWTDPANGFYKRLIVPGTWSLIFRAPGYTPATRTNVTVTSGWATTLNVALSKASDPPGFLLKKDGITFISVNQNAGDLDIPGVSQTAPFKGMILSCGTPAVAVDNTGNLTSSGVSTSQGTFLDNSSNLSGGLVIRDQNGRAVVHFSNSGYANVRGSLLRGFPDN